MHRFVAAVAPLAQSLGGVGLAVVAFLDSSFLSFPSVPDLGVVWLVTQHPSRWLYYAAAPTVGSVAGCYALYALARKGGEAFLRKRLHERHVERGLAAFRRYGLLAVVVPAVLPPPMPFKVFVLLAGVAEVNAGTFVLAVTIGRGFRFGAEALLAHRYGDQAGDFIRHNLAQVSIWFAVALTVIGVALVLWRRRRPA
jgi:membrane protein YqaA with SNARE-associated domain